MKRLNTRLVWTTDEFSSCPFGRCFQRHEAATLCGRTNTAGRVILSRDPIWRDSIRLIISRHRAYRFKSSYGTGRKLKKLQSMDVIVWRDTTAYAACRWIALPAAGDDKRFSRSCRDGMLWKDHTFIVEARKLPVWRGEPPQYCPMRRNLQQRMVLQQDSATACG